MDGVYDGAAARSRTGRLAYALVNGRQHWSWTTPRGGSGELPKALARLIEAHGGTILTGKWASGSFSKTANALASNAGMGRSTAPAAPCCLPSTSSTWWIWLPARPGALTSWQGVETWQGGPTLFAAHYATTEPPTYAVDGGALAPVASGTGLGGSRAARGL